LTRRLKIILPSLMMVALILLFPWAGTLAQFFEQKDVFGYSELDYEKIFKEGLSANGKTLNLSGKKIGDTGIEVLLTKDFLKKVTKLDLRYNKISERGAKRMAESRSFGKLKSLELKHNYLLDNGAVALAQSGGFPNLEKLSLGWNEIRDAGALAFAKTKTLPKLKKLDLRGNFLADETKNTLKKDLAHLKSLKLF
jgi:Ran GTPase-activating protein (RanGAP) involved in mRNA processing and transport